MIKATFISNTSKFLFKFNRNKQSTLNKMGEYVQPVIINEAPERTGDLKKSVGYEATKNSLFVFANKFYATFVELGTYKMKANPFIKRAIFKSVSEFTRLIIQGLKV